jgi:hypothetical protein
MEIRNIKVMMKRISWRIFLFTSQPIPGKRKQCSARMKLSNKI